MAYAAHYYAAQWRVIEQMRFAYATGLCPVCRERPQAIWPNGARRMTCGKDECFRRWLPVKAGAQKEGE